ncbi:MHS family MFS transporter [Microvirga terricola]|uniref:MHS family MFS transporter n=1 Tax=Microvirga terricola TaxID=2719797 RepID=A0ABX0VA56_9HYPH|nr:MHS family MFS transporter [Microvirga terricola]NIX75936.1 MHS family MFS transporter [Microvirga terricola]
MLEQAVISGSKSYQHVRDTAASRKAVISGSVGSALEWFDFSIYGAVSATVFPALFFSEMTPGTALLASFATFGAGFFARPLGGLVFGALGDKLGRKRVLTWTLLLMGFASALIGILPGYGQIGILAPPCSSCCASCKVWDLAARQPDRSFWRWNTRRTTAAAFTAP